ncbi:GGDEF domain-containing protein [Nitrospirillum iridis]|uniref:EAL domain-containing protein (Putative c-di-GMP-specific phosphodiesterase class I)/GGDEF domain-containing protein n=1 Tax=Nitrospirillum iridis TaxID=765888 RepID=A0A7X0EF67_9PROT|nr:GGDEF domain-containing protein [Nitrospirillum iridis]MBB6252766.1 EAL domain-containing protein (putative c-di-GMP-specific phosphodiesterase class I)/GGDEF domain-containing protein [Nitrospirillum iridis]
MPEERETGIPRQGHHGSLGAGAAPPSVPGAATVQDLPMALPPRWRDVVAHLYPVFQPIVQMRTARVHGHEALLRGVEAAGFPSLAALFEAAVADGALPGLEAHIQGAAVAAFLAAGGTADVRLFLNVHPLAQGQVPPPLQGEQLHLVYETSGEAPLATRAGRDGGDRRGRVDIAFDRFGVGVADFQRLLSNPPSYVKIDRAFVAGVDGDQAKRALLGQLVGSAHALGLATIAVGVETSREFYVCRDLGCDHVQGFLLGRPGTGLLAEVSEIAESLARSDRRRPAPARQRLFELIERIAPLPLEAPKAKLLEYFGNLAAPPVVPVVDRAGVPRGLIRERHLKPFVYSRYGTELLRNRSFGNTLKDFIIPCPVCDIGTPLERVIELFAEAADSDGVIIVEGGEYVGFLSSQSLVRLLHEHRLATAVDQNPLTRLPGNNAITNQVETLVADIERDHVLVYLDFDNFKPFNDYFGFRQGDRAILMFSEQLKVQAAALGGFVGHIGGDDFFLSCSGLAADRVRERLVAFLTRFRSDAESLYDVETRERGWFEAKDREGRMRRYPLLRVSAVMVPLVAGSARPGLETLVELIAVHKTAAKAAPDNLFLVAG